MVNITVLEIHLDGDPVANFTRDASTEAPADGAEDGDAPESSAGGREWLAATVGLLFLAVLGALARRRLGREEGYPAPPAEAELELS